jgi:hypothetical protein
MDRSKAMADIQVKASHEWLAHDPFGQPKAADVSQWPVSITDAKGNVMLRAARNGYVSFRVLVQGAGEYRISASVGGDLEADLFKVWYHRMERDGAPSWWPDALVPLKARTSHTLPDPDNAVDGQTTQEFWVDIFVPKDHKPGKVSGRVRVAVGDETLAVPIKIDVLETTIPDEPCVIIDHNSYGCRFLPKYFPKQFGANPRGAKLWDNAISILHDYHRLVHEHRGLLSNLGYGHSGSYDPIYAPQIEGSGRDLKLTNWELFDRYHGPLLDGSVFETAAPGNPHARRAAKPIWGVYAPLNPEFPANYLHYGEKGYETEFVSGVKQFDAHLQEKGWTQSRVAFYLNHKKRYRWFGWDGDEVKDIKDMKYQYEIVEMWEKAIEGSSVPWLYRMDASWQMKNIFPLMAGHPNFWVCGGFHRWYPNELAEVVARGDEAWWYGGTASITAASSSIMSPSYETWMRGLHGNCAWLSTGCGADPWFNSDGGGTGQIYPGERFGIKGPIPSCRLKIERNGIQDIDLLNQAVEASGDKGAVQEELKTTIPVPIWKKPPKAAVELPPEEWDSRTLQEEHEPGAVEQKELDPNWWQAIRNRALPEGRN